MQNKCKYHQHSQENPNSSQDFWQQQEEHILELKQGDAQLEACYKTAVQGQVYSSEVFYII